jgi:hypothetical protein
MRQSLLPNMARSLKKVVLRKWNQEWLSGYLPPAAFVHEGSLDLLDLGGKVLPTPLSELKWVCFVRDFNSGEIANPERLLRKNFAGRPRTAGLWVRTTLKDGDPLEGIAENNISLVSSQGLFLVPPDTRSNTQRIFLPAGSITSLEVLSVIGASSRISGKRKLAAKADVESQPDLFSKSDSR